jgi:hypothetical protein
MSFKENFAKSGQTNFKYDPAKGPVNEAIRAAKIIYQEFAPLKQGKARDAVAGFEADELQQHFTKDILNDLLASDNEHAALAANMILQHRAAKASELHLKDEPAALKALQATKAAAVQYVLNAGDKLQAANWQAKPANNKPKQDGPSLGL